MRKINLILFLFFTLPLFPQLNEGFDDGRFTGEDRETVWLGDTENFIVNKDLQLQLNAPSEAGTSQLRTRSTRTMNTVWEFYVKMDFTVTASNYTRVYLTSDAEDLNGELNGIFIRIGHTQKNICLIQSEKGKANKTLISGAARRLPDNQTSVYIKATLDKHGNFKLYSQLGNESEFILEGKCKLSDIGLSDWFGVNCVYTKTRNRHFYFDDFLIRELRDDEQEEHLIAESGDILFSEIMANPEGNPTVYPEYIELYNNTDKIISLEGNRLYYGDKAILLFGEIADRSYCVLCKESAVGLFPEGLPVIGIPSFPTLANTGKLLMLTNSEDKLISWFEYSDKMYNDNEKKSGGWSIECMDLSNDSNSASNWSASTDPTGGTPGKANSVQTSNPDTINPFISSYTFSENKIDIIFSKPMDINTLTNKSNYSINGEYRIASIEINYPQGNNLQIELDTNPKENEFFILSFNGVSDRSGNKLEEEYIIIGYAHSPAINDIVINELLFNPPVGGVEYVELYNRSSHIIDLRFLSITSRKSKDGSFNKIYPFTNQPLFLFPEEYLVLTKEKELVCSFFNCIPDSYFVEPGGMPPITNTSGCVIILNNTTNEIIDELTYNEDMHSFEIKEKKGASLERVDINRPTSDINNWRSASHSCGFGTPGYENSQYLQDSIVGNDKNKVWVVYPTSTSEHFEIKYSLNKSNYLANILLYNTSGQRTDIMLDKHVIDSQGSLYWTKDSYDRLSSGVYIIYMEITDQSGKVEKFKIPILIQ